MAAAKGGAVEIYLIFVQLALQERCLTILGTCLHMRFLVLFLHLRWGGHLSESIMLTFFLQQVDEFGGGAELLSDGDDEQANIGTFGFGGNDDSDVEDGLEGGDGEDEDAEPEENEEGLLEVERKAARTAIKRAREEADAAAELEDQVAGDGEGVLFHTLAAEQFNSTPYRCDLVVRVVCSVFGGGLSYIHFVASDHLLFRCLTSPLRSLTLDSVAHCALGRRTPMRCERTCRRLWTSRRRASA